MWPRPKLPGRLATLAGLSVAFTSAATSPAHAAPDAAVSLGEVKISMEAGIEGPAARELGRVLRAVLNDELKQVAALGSPKRPLIVSATLTRVSSERMAFASKASATISLAVLHADDRVLFAELRGRASIEKSSDNLAALRNAALRRAAQRAFSRLPEAMQRSD